eukprot:GILJ01006320.1.p1 GENE.GILJ01006320.1~~GILJ01006320.1.p1  ORF type:complete len:386 (+),score=54.41 GILJ01006320.1:44-1159(+)
MDCLLHPDLFASLPPHLQQEVQNLQKNKALIRPPRPTLPVLKPSMSMRQKIHIYQQFIESFEYNYTGRNYFRLHKDRGIKSVTNTSQQIIRDALPIKCLEATMLAIFLTHEFMDVDRFPVSFTSSVEGQKFQHIVLAVRHQNTWGAMGLSRKQELMYKPLKFSSLGALMEEFKTCYEKCWHSLQKIKIGLPILHNAFSSEPVRWRILNLHIDRYEWDDCMDVLDRFAYEAQKIVEDISVTGKISLKLKDFQTVTGKYGSQRLKPRSELMRRTSSTRSLVTANTTSSHLYVLSPKARSHQRSTNGFEPASFEQRDQFNNDSESSSESTSSASASEDENDDSAIEPAPLSDTNVVSNGRSVSNGPTGVRYLAV